MNFPHIRKQKMYTKNYTQFEYKYLIYFMNIAEENTNNIGGKTFKQVFCENINEWEKNNFKDQRDFLILHVKVL